MMPRNPKGYAGEHISRDHRPAPPTTLPALCPAGHALGRPPVPGARKGAAQLIAFHVALEACLFSEPRHAPHREAQRGAPELRLPERDPSAVEQERTVYLLEAPYQLHLELFAVRSLEAPPPARVGGD